MASYATSTRDHGGNLDSAMARYGGARDAWVDLSTGINPLPYPVPHIPSEAWEVLPRRTEMQALQDAARAAYATSAHVVPFAGAQAAIQVLPWITTPGQARILGPTYNEHAAAFRLGGWQVEERPSLADLAGATCAVVVNPNNPDGRSFSPQDLQALARDVGTLIVDESFADPTPDLSLAPHMDRGPDNIVLLRSFGKFYGLAGLRLGFALAKGQRAARLSDLAGPWPVSGPALSVARQALADKVWAVQTIARLSSDAARLDALATQSGWSLVGGTPLFRSYQTPDATEAQDHLARHQLWSRIFPYSESWIRLGLPPESGWAQVERAFSALR